MEEGTAHIGATRDKNGSYAMVYLPHGQAVTLNLSKISGLYAIAWWYDPRTGQATRVVGGSPTNQLQSFTPPTHGVENDWVLVLDDENKKFGAPGGGG